MACGEPGGHAALCLNTSGRICSGANFQPDMTARAKQRSAGICRHLETAAVLMARLRATAAGPPRAFTMVLAFMISAINPQLPTYVNCQLPPLHQWTGKVVGMGERRPGGGERIKLGPGQTAAMGARLKQRISVRRKTAAWLARQVGCSPAYISKVINGNLEPSGGGLAFWVKAAVALDDSLDYIVFGSMPTGDPEFTKITLAMLNREPNARERMLAYLGKQEKSTSSAGRF